MASSSSTIFGSSSCCCSCSVPLLCSLRPSSITYGPWSSGLCFWGRRVGAPSLRLQVKSSRASEGSEQKWVTKGVITESLPNGMFWVRLDNGDVVLGYISGKIRRNSIRMLAGDKVKIEVSRYDSTRGRIVYRISTKET